LAISAVKKMVGTQSPEQSSIQLNGESEGSMHSKAIANRQAKV
jgi:hypothetical protein